MALYSQSRLPGTDADPAAWEVVILHFKKPRKIGETLLAGGEQLPSDAEWGVFGWTLTSLGRARQKFDEVSTIDRIQAARASMSKLAGT